MSARIAPLRPDLLLLVRAASPENQETWLEKATTLTCKDLEAYVRRSPEGGDPVEIGDSRGLPRPTTKLDAKLDKHVAERFQEAMDKLRAETGQEDLNEADAIAMMADLVLTTNDDGTTPGRTPVDADEYVVHLTKVGEDGPLLVDTDDGLEPFLGEGLLEEQLEAILAENAIFVDENGDIIEDLTTPKWLRKKVKRRDKRRCRCCGTKHQVHIHHIIWRENGGPTEGWNLITLCIRCHSMVHAGLIKVFGKDAKHVAFFDRKGRPLDRIRGYVRLEALRKISCRLRDGPLVKARSVLQPVSNHFTIRWIEKQAFGDAFRAVVARADVLEALRTAAEAADARNTACPHVLFKGPPGTGKTSLARALARTRGTRFLHTVGAEISSKEGVEEFLAALEPSDVVFIDEIHSVSAGAMELLYGAMQDQKVPFTLIAATTKEARVDDALISRFGLRIELGFYSVPELMEVVTRRAEIDGIRVKSDAAKEIAAAARGIPREALRLLDRSLDQVALKKKGDVLRVDEVREALRLEGYDDKGLTPDEQRVLRIVEKHGPISLSQIAKRVGKDREAVGERIEPMLLRRNLIAITDRGRVPTGRGAPVEYAKRSSEDDLDGLAVHDRSSNGYGGQPQHAVEGRGVMTHSAIARRRDNECHGGYPPPSKTSGSARFFTRIRQFLLM